MVESTAWPPERIAGLLKQDSTPTIRSLCAEIERLQADCAECRSEDATIMSLSARVMELELMRSEEIANLRIDYKARDQRRELLLRGSGALFTLASRSDTSITDYWRSRFVDASARIRAELGDER